MTISSSSSKISEAESKYGTWAEPPEQTSLSKTLEDTKAYLDRYVVFSTELPKEAGQLIAKEPTAEVIIIALWVAHCHAFPGFDFTPYLRISSPVKRCGKTRVFDCLILVGAVSRGKSSLLKKRRSFAKSRRIALSCCSTNSTRWARKPSRASLP